VGKRGKRFYKGKPVQEKRELTTRIKTEEEGARVLQRGGKKAFDLVDLNASSNGDGGLLFAPA